MSYVCLEHTRPFTSDAGAEPTGSILFHIKFGISSLTYRDVGNAIMILGVSLAHGGQSA